jgi:beta-glucosidase
MPWLPQVNAVVQAWYPGQRGGEAIARILFGEVNPSGRLPITFPAGANQPPRPAPVGLDLLASPDAATAAANSGGGSTATVTGFPVVYAEGSNVGYRWYEAKQHTPLFAFGHGLSYTSFRYTNLKVRGGNGLSVEVDVTNSGRLAGADVPQLYVASINGARPARLAAFERVSLKPGETRRITLTAEPRVLANWDERSRGWHIPAGSYRITVAKSAIDRSLSRDVALHEQRFKP